MPSASSLIADSPSMKPTRTMSFLGKQVCGTNAHSGGWARRLGEGFKTPQPFPSEAQGRGNEVPYLPDDSVQRRGVEPTLSEKSPPLTAFRGVLREFIGE